MDPGNPTETSNDVPKLEMTRVALVTGSGTGLGAHLAERLAESGFSIWHHCRHDHKRAAIEAEKVAARFPSRAMGALVADLAHPDEVRLMFDRIRVVSGRLDVLVNNVGIYQRKQVDHVTPEEWREVIDTNLNGTFYCSHYALPLLKRSQGLVINIGDSSLEHQASDVHATAYRASKHGVLVLTRSMAEQCGRDGVRFNVVSPGQMSNSTWQPEGLVAKIPLGRVGRHDDIWRACDFLIRTEYVTGANIDVAGGYRLSLAMWHGQHEDSNTQE